MNKIVFFVDKRKFETDKNKLSVQEILVDFAKVSTDDYILALKHGNEIKEYNDLNEIIEMKNGMHFSLFSKEPTTVS